LAQGVKRTYDIDLRASAAAGLLGRRLRFFDVFQQRPHSTAEVLTQLIQHFNVEAFARLVVKARQRAAIDSRGEASVNEIATPFAMSQPAVSKHLKVLERAGLIERNVDKQRRPARLKAEPMAAAVGWLEEFRQFWSSSFDQLDGLLETLKKAEKRRSRK
jgi:DNA-binding transcriptional ArsR family regulator